MENKPTRVVIVTVILLMLAIIGLATAIIIEKTDLDSSSDASELKQNPIMEKIMNNTKTDITNDNNIRKDKETYRCSSDKFCKSYEKCVNGICVDR